MGEQLSFDFGPLPPSDILYFALRPDAVAARAMAEVARRCRRGHGLPGSAYGADRLHVSLSAVQCPRGVRKGDIAAALRAAARVKAVRFPVAFDRLCTFQGHGKHPTVLCCGGGAAPLVALRERLRGELAKEGLCRGRDQFEPHVTLWWSTQRLPPSHLDEPIRWTVEDFVLVRSLVGHSRHIDLRRWPLGPAVGGH